MGSKALVFLILSFIQVCAIGAQTNGEDLAKLNALKDIWDNTPPNWVGIDPCGSNWVGIGCNDSRVTSITLSGIGLKGQLSGDISSFSALQILDLSYNKDLTGSLPATIGNLKQLTNLILIGCGFTGPIPDSIGSLQQLISLSLNSNRFNGQIPPSIGNLSKLYLLDLTDNQLEGPIPVSRGSTPGLDMLVLTGHFHLGKNRLSGTIPAQLFHSRMSLIHVLFEDNNLSGGIPSSIGQVGTLEVLRLGRNSLTGPVPSSLSNPRVNELVLSNNQLSGPIPDLSAMTVLGYLDLSNNTFDAATFPPWILNSNSLAKLTMEHTELRGQVPPTLFGLPNLQTVILNNNQLNGSLVLGSSLSNQLQVVDLQENFISDYKGGNQVTVILAGNPVCLESGTTESYCTVPPRNSYVTEPNNCDPAQCTSNQISSPNCKCAYPYTGRLVFTAPLFSDFGNPQIYLSLQQSLMNFLYEGQLPVDSVSLSNPRKDDSEYLDIDLQIFPSLQDSFNRPVISRIGFVLNNHTFKPPKEFGFGPFFFSAGPYVHFAEENGGSSKSSTGIIIGAGVGGTVLLVLLILAGLYAYRRKKRAEKANHEINPFANWDTKNNSGGVPHLKGARRFSFEELNNYTNNFSESNDIGSGGYGKVYRGTLPSGQLIAIKRAQQGSMQGGLEFKTEIELLSRVHHKNLVGLLGFCFEQGEQMLVYEFVPNGNIRDSLSGQTGIRLHWIRRLEVALGAARGLAYLHELASPPIIHRDIKTTNILLDERLNAKVGDFGLSRLLGDSEKGHVTTQVKGTMGYLDPEYYITQQLTEKSDVYSFGVVMLELITGRRPIERGKYIVRELKMTMDRTKDLYNLQEILDPGIGLDTSLKGLTKFVDLALKCVQDSRDERPTMGEVVKEIENILELAGLNPNAESASSSATYEKATKGASHPYSKDAFEYSGGLPPSKIEPQ
ncbi:hypothetical protein K2173_020859 [Erythroxylum novogranatense]|uniref:non-specific serine/threonine protein kinase n=1 Tax=Erythroxylum novogranatense TaxID=1862640 RepID=A0AAV8TP50_9ROSI|nr:hypothetical protein K2173_020859 [Erythroxylum novogranatense]